MSSRDFNGPYTGDHLQHVAFPLGGLGAGMICLEGAGAFSAVSLRHQPEINNEPMLFAALHIKGDKPLARVLEGPVPSWKVLGTPDAGNGLANTTYGLPRFAEASFIARFPFAAVTLADPAVPVQADVTGWIPFTPGDADSSSLPAAMVEYRFTNPKNQTIEAVFSFHAENFMRKGEGERRVRRTADGFAAEQDGTAEQPWDAGAFAVGVDEPDAVVNCRWFRGGWFDALTILWKDIAEGNTPANDPVTEGKPSPGGSLFVPFTLQPGEMRTIRVRLSWYVPVTNLRINSDDKKTDCASGCECGDMSVNRPTYQPWYAGRFASIDEVAGYWQAQASDLCARSADFRDCLYDNTLPAEVQEAISANLTILKSPTILRQVDGRIWCWEGCCETTGCCHGSCTHVWNYAQAIAHLFPELERGMRQSEFIDNQDAKGHQNFRTALPIAPETDHSFHAASDGQLGGIMKVYRDWRISGDTEWLRNFWSNVRKSLDYCIETWDPEHTGVLVEPHHNTYDIEFWGPDGMCTSFYLGALIAAARMAEALGEDGTAYSELAEKSRHLLENDLYNGEYFIQQIRWQGLRAADPASEAGKSIAGEYSPEALELLHAEGPRYQYGNGCLSDGVMGAWLAEVCGVGRILDDAKVTSHLLAVHRYNLKRDLSEHANPQRPGYALGKEGGLLLCSWPHGDALSLPFVYSNEVWTGIEYQVASHLIRMKCVDEGLEIVRIARERHDGRVRNPFDEYECGHWYGRALSSCALLFALTGARYDAVEQALYLSPRLAGDFRAPLVTAGGYGTVGMRDGQPFLEVRSGSIPVTRIEMV